MLLLLLLLVIFEGSSRCPITCKNRVVLNLYEGSNVLPSYIGRSANRHALHVDSQKRQQTLHISIETRACQERGNLGGKSSEIVGF